MIISLAVFAAAAALVCTGAARTLDFGAETRLWYAVNPALTAAMIRVSNLGEWYIYVGLAVILLVIPRARTRLALPSAIVLAVAGLLNFILKAIFAVPRPEVYRLIPETGYSFPSGHAMIGTAFWGFFAYLLSKIVKRTWLKILIWTPAAGFMLTVGFSRVYLGVHNPTDVCAGYFAGTAVVCAGIIAYEMFWERLLWQRSCQRS